MADINLLPWREAAREERRRQFISVLVGVLVLGCLVGYAGEFVRQGQIESQQLRNNHIVEATRELDRQVAEIRQLQERKQQMLARMDVIKNLQNSRPEVVRQFDEFVRVLPDGAYIQSVRARGVQIAIQGTSQSNNRISNFMRNLDASDKYRNPNLTQVNANRELGDQGSNFNMGVVVIPNTLNQ